LKRPLSRFSLFISKALGPASWRKRMLFVPLVAAAFLFQFTNISGVPRTVQSGAFFGCMSGMLFGLRYRPLRTVKISAPSG